MKFYIKHWSPPILISKAWYFSLKVQKIKKSRLVGYLALYVARRSQYGLEGSKSWLISPKWRLPTGLVPLFHPYSMTHHWWLLIQNLFDALPCTANCSLGVCLPRVVFSVSESHSTAVVCLVGTFWTCFFPFFPCGSLVE